MLTQKGNLHLEIQTSRKNPVGLIRTTFWDKKAKKYRHTQHGRISGCGLDQLKLLQLAFGDKVAPLNDEHALKILSSRELGASRAVLSLARELGLHRILYSRTEPWVQRVMAMIVGRVVYQGSKLSLCNQWANTCLWDLCGVEGSPDVDRDCYEPLDALLQRQKAIQKKLAAQHLGKGSMVLYDITSTYFEGAYQASELVEFGYNRDRKKGFEQVVVGLITNEEGCPVGCEVFEGNTKDETTVMDKIEEVRNQYGLKSFIFVGDRGMVTQGQFEKIRALETVRTISALTHAQIRDLLKRKVLQPELFDENNIVEILDPDERELRYCLCKNPNRQKEDGQTRRRLLEKTREGLEAIADYKKRTTVEHLGARVGKLLSKYRMGKFVTWSVTTDTGATLSAGHKLQWTFDQEKIEREERLDGCYVIRADVAEEAMNAQGLVDAYKSLGDVERAFRNLKTVQLEIRPVYHKKDDRIRAHIFLCMLAYYVQWHMIKRLRPLFEADGQGADRRWTFSGVLDRLRQHCRHEICMNGICFERETELDDEQQKITDLLNPAI